MHPLVAFYKGQGTDHRGRTLAGILTFSNSELETCHDYIQWLFPLRTASPYNPEAPVVDDEVELAFRTDLDLQGELHRALLRMLQFYSIVLRETPQGFEFLMSESVSDIHWMIAENHNHKRLTRMLLSLRTLGLEAHVAAIWQGLQRLAEDYPDAITAQTLEYWQNAATGKR